MKLVSINFFDYRAFYNGQDGQYLIKIDSKNLLVYGENGSGKTSFYKGLKDFFYGNDFIEHNQTPRLNEGFIQIEFSDSSTERLDGAGNKPQKPEIANVSKLNSFLSYKELLRTHLEDAEEINFFDLLVNNLLADHLLDSLGPLKTAWEIEKNKNIEIEEEKISKGVLDEEITSEEAKEQKEIAIQKLDEEHNKFRDEISLLIDQVNKKIIEILDYFNQKLEVKLKLHTINWKAPTDSRITLEVKSFGKKVDSHQELLNEARLSAIAISIYFTSIKLNPTNDTIKILFLDDIFIGLDTSNRLPLLKILREQFTDWQVILTTYDRHWFEIAKLEMDSAGWLFYEMYVTINDNPVFEYPVIIADSDDYLSKAKKHYAAKDYPACLNYIRKEIEKEVKERLPAERVRHYEGKPHGLSHLWELMSERYSAIGKPLPKQVQESFKTTRLTLLNPLAHDNLSQPVYKYEIEKAFNLAVDLSSVPILKNIILLVSGMELEFIHPSLNYSLKFELLTDWRLEMINNVKTHVLPKCKLKYWQFNGRDYWNFKTNSVCTDDEKKSILDREDKLNKVQENLSKIPSLEITKSLFEANTSFEKIWTIKRIIEDSQNRKRNLFYRVLSRLID